MAQKRKYIVTQPNTRGHEVGDEIELTDEDARKLVNKVRRKDSKPQAAGQSDKEEKLTKQLAERDEQIETYKTQVAELNEKLDAADIESLQAQLAERDQIIANLSTELEQLNGGDGE